MDVPVPVPVPSSKPMGSGQRAVGSGRVRGPSESQIWAGSSKFAGFQFSVFSFRVGDNCTTRAMEQTRRTGQPESAGSAESREQRVLCTGEQYALLLILLLILQLLLLS